MKCPDCDFTYQEESEYIDHLTENHPVIARPQHVTNRTKMHTYRNNGLGADICVNCEHIRTIPDSTLCQEAIVESIDPIEYDRVRLEKKVDKILIRLDELELSHYKHMVQLHPTGEEDGE